VEGEKGEREKGRRGEREKGRRGERESEAEAAAGLVASGEVAVDGGDSSYSNQSVI